MTTLAMDSTAQLSVTAPTRVSYVLEPDGTFTCPTDAQIVNNSAVPVAVKSWDAEVKAGNAVAQADFASASAKNAWWNDVAADGGEASAYNMDADELYDSWNMAASGMRLPAGNDDALTLTFSGAMKNMDGSVDVNASKQLASVTMAFGTMLNGKNEPKPDPESGMMFAVYSADDNSLDFYKRDRLPKVGAQFNGKTVTAVWDGLEDAEYSYNSIPWYKSYRSAIKSVSFVDNGCKPISLAHWFEDLMKMTSFDGSKLDTSSVRSLESTFADCSSLTNLDLSSWDVLQVESMDKTFYCCCNLANLDISEWNTVAVNSMDKTFYGCEGLTSLDVSSWDTSSITTLENTFTGCSELMSLDSIASWNTSSITSLEETFADCSNLESLDLSNWDVSSVTSLAHTFAGCSSLTNLGDIANWNTCQVSSLEGTFAYCSMLTNLNLSNWETSYVTTIGNLFDNCSELMNLDLSSWSTGNVTEVENAFGNCNKLTNVTIGDEWTLGEIWRQV